MKLNGKPVKIFLADFPAGVHGICSQDERFFFIGINEGLPRADQLRSLAHEVAHIMAGRLDRGGDPAALEAEARAMAAGILEGRCDQLREEIEKAALFRNGCLS